MKIQIIKDDDKIEDVKVLKIKKEDLKEGNVLKLPKDITAIGKEACEDLIGIEGLKIIFSESIKEIGEKAFEGLNIDYIIFSDNIEEVGKEAFKNCTFNKEIIMPESVIKKGYKTFENSTFKGEVIIAEGVESISCEKFKKCVFDKKLVLPDTIKKIESECFHYANFKEGIELSNELKSISYNGFSHAKLDEIKLPNGLKYIYSGAFDGCHLKECKIPESIVHIGRDAFSFCDLEEVRIPSLAEIGDHAFQYNKLKRIYITEEQCAELTKQKKYIFIGNEDAQIYIYENDYIDENAKELPKQMKKKILKKQG